MKHQQEYHGGSVSVNLPSAECRKCSKYLRSQEACDEHLVTEHPYECNICPLKFIEGNDLILHLLCIHFIRPEKIDLPSYHKDYIKINPPEISLHEEEANPSSSQINDCTKIKDELEENKEQPEKEHSNTNKREEYFEKSEPISLHTIKKEDEDVEGKKNVDLKPNFKIEEKALIKTEPESKVENKEENGEYFEFEVC